MTVLKAVKHRRLLLSCSSSTVSRRHLLTMSSYYGSQMCCNLSVYDPNTRFYHSLPPTGVHASISIRDVYAKVKLSQTFVNKAEKVSANIWGKLEAVYTFPLPPASAVCAFEAVWDDGTKTKGVVKEKAQAKEEYEKAKKAGVQAGIVEQERDDIFTMRVGNIPAGGKTTINLTYVIELADDGDRDHVRFTLPTTIAPKYSSGPTYGSSSIYSNIDSPDCDFTFEACVEMAEKIQSVSSPSHQLTVSPVSEREMNVALGSTAALTKDLVLVVKANGLDAPRAFIEAWEAPVKTADHVFTEEKTSSTKKTKAIGLTLVPKYTPKALPGQEYIFLLDRSGSMGGDKMESLRKAMQLILRSLPPPSVSQTHIQIISFGSHSSPLFDKGSVPYDEAALKTASAHCKVMDADFGGTEIASALQAAIKSRRQDVPTSLFVLTDGETWNLKECLDIIRSARSADETSPLRVFSLGIGPSVDHLLVQSLADVGEGIAMFVGENERLESKVMRLLRAAKAEGVRVKEISWGAAGVAGPPTSLTSSQSSDDHFEIIDLDEQEKQTSKSLFDADHQEEAMPANDSSSLKNTTKSVILPPLPGILTAPASIPHLYPGSRFTVYALLSDEKATALEAGDQTIKISATTDSGEILELSVAINKALQPSSVFPEDTPLIHTLASRKLVKAWSNQADAPKSKVTTPSKSTDDALAILEAQTVRLCITYGLASAHTSFVAIKETKDGEVLQPAQRSSHEEPPAYPEQVSMHPGQYSARSTHAVGVCSRSSEVRARSFMPSGGGNNNYYMHGRSNANFASSAAPPSPYSCPSTYGAAPPAGYGHAADEEAPSRVPAPTSIEDKLDELVEEQAFDGSWPSLAKVKVILAMTADEQAPETVIWATVLALTWIGAHDASQGTYTAILEKGWEWIGATVGDNAEVKRLKSEASLKVLGGLI